MTTNNSRLAGHLDSAEVVGERGVRLIEFESPSHHSVVYRHTKRSPVAVFAHCKRETSDADAFLDRI